MLHFDFHNFTLYVDLTDTIAFTTLIPCTLHFWTLPYKIKYMTYLKKRTLGSGEIFRALVLNLFWLSVAV